MSNISSQLISTCFWHLLVIVIVWSNWRHQRFHLCHGGLPELIGVFVHLWALRGGNLQSNACHGSPEVLLDPLQRFRFGSWDPKCYGGNAHFSALKFSIFWFPCLDRHVEGKIWDGPFAFGVQAFQLKRTAWHWLHLLKPSVQLLRKKNVGQLGLAVCTWIPPANWNIPSNAKHLIGMPVG